MSRTMARKRAKPKPPPAPPPPNEWPARLRTLRDRLGLNQTEAGAKIGVSQNLWSAWERGTRVPDASRQILITLLDQGKIGK